jgi:lipoprotein-releasing system permease protein
LIFVIQGALLGLLGTLAGDIVGIVIALKLDVIVPAIERLLGMQFFPADVYYVTTLPAQLRAGDVTMITALSLCLCLLATVYPSRRAAGTQPVEALRYA